MAKNENRCWPGYEPVKGKRANEQGSCRKKAESKSSDSEKKFQAKRDKQIEEYSKRTGSPRRGAQGSLPKPGTKAAKKAAAKQTARKRAGAKKTAAKRTHRPASKKSTTKRATAKRTATKRAARKRTAAKRTQGRATAKRSR
jgi:DNA-binding protein HU-beta